MPIIAYELLLAGQHIIICCPEDALVVEENETQGGTVYAVIVNGTVVINLFGFQYDDHLFLVGQSGMTTGVQITVLDQQRERTRVLGPSEAVLIPDKTIITVEQNADLRFVVRIEVTGSSGSPVGVG